MHLKNVLFLKMKNNKTVFLILHTMPGFKNEAVHDIA